MKKSVLFFCAALCAVILVINSSETAPQVEKDVTWINIAIDFWDAAISESAEKAASAVDKAIADLNYANVETSIKYRISRILSYVKNDPGSGVSSKILSNVKQFFGGGVIRNEDSFFAVCQKIYDDYLTKDASFSENSGHFASNARNIDTSFLSKVLCERLSVKYAASPDGTIWLYGENYFAAFTEREMPDYILLSPRGNTGLSIEKKLSSKSFFERKNSVVFCEEPLSADFSAISVYDEFSPDNRIICERYSPLEKIVYFDFTSYKYKSK